MRLIVIVSLGLAVLGNGSAGPAASQGVARTAAQTYPGQPIRLVVPWPPGGTADTLGRIIAQHLATSFGQQVVADNRPGAGSTIGVGIVAKSMADGHTLLYTDVTTITINATFYRKLPYDAIGDLTPVTMVGTSPLLLVVHPSLPARTVREFIAQKLEVAAGVDICRRDARDAIRMSDVPGVRAFARLKAHGLEKGSPCAVGDNGSVREERGDRGVHCRRQVRPPGVFVPVRPLRLRWSCIRRRRFCRRIPASPARRRLGS